MSDHEITPEERVACIELIGEFRTAFSTLPHPKQRERIPVLARAFGELNLVQRKYVFDNAPIAHTRLPVMVQLLDALQPHLAQPNPLTE